MNVKKIFLLLLFTLLSACEIPHGYIGPNSNIIPNTEITWPARNVAVYLKNNSPYWFEASLVSTSFNVKTSTLTQCDYPKKSILKAKESSEMSLLDYDENISEDELNNSIRSFMVILEFNDGSKVYIEGLPEEQSQTEDAAYYGLGYHQGANRGFTSILDTDNQYSILSYTITVNEIDDIDIQLNQKDSELYSPEETAEDL